MKNQMTCFIKVSLRTDLKLVKFLSVFLLFSGIITAVALARPGMKDLESAAFEFRADSSAEQNMLQLLEDYFSEGHILIDFDSLPVTGTNQIPGDGGSWRYSSHITNTGFDFNGSCGFWNTTSYKDNPSVHDYVSLYKNTYNSSHMGFESYSYLEIDNARAIKGNSLKITVTGGKTDSGSGVETHGLPLFCKEEYMTYIQNSQNPVDTSVNVGCPNLYLSNNSSSVGSTNYVFPTSKGANRLSFYIYLPAGLKNDVNGTSRHERMITIGPYSDQPNPDLFPSGHPRYDVNGTVSGHWYHDVMVEGGAWIHVDMDSHPVHNNSFYDSSYFPYPSSSIRSIGESYFDNMYKLYVSAYPYEGLAKPPYSMWMDEFIFTSDSEPQNDETIGTLAVGYWPGDKEFQISFCDKYFGSKAYATYEIRYSLNPITNANWTGATLAEIVDDPRWDEVSSTGPGRIQKHTPNYRRVWGSFKLNSADESKLTVGRTVYFAVKDVSQSITDDKDPVSSNKGRDYRNEGASFDYAGDSPVLGLIKRIDYYISGN